MATTVSKQYKLATDNGMLSSKYSEQQFVELLQDTNRRKAYYDFVKKKNPDFYSNDFDTFSRNVDSMLANYTPPTPTNMEQAASVSAVSALPTNQQTEQSATEDKRGSIVSPIMSPHAAAYQAAENFANQQQKDQAERERINNAQLPTSDNDKQREKDLQRLNERIEADAYARNPYTQQWLPEDVKKQVQAGREENIEGLKQVRDELQGQRAKYMEEPKTLEEAFESYATAWTQNTEEGKAALKEVDNVRIGKIEQLKNEFYNTKTAIDIFADVEDKYQKGNLTFDEANEELNNRLNTAFITEYEDQIQKIDNERNSILAKRVNAADNGWLKRQQERILENGAADALDENYETISNAIAKSIEENRAMGITIGNAMGGSAEMAAAQSLMVPPELKAALQLYQEAETLLYDTKKGEGNFWTFGKEIVRHSKNKFRDLATFGGSTIADAAVQANVLKKIAEAGAYEAPEKVLSENEMILYDAIVTELAVELVRKDNRSYGAMAGQMTAEMIPFVRDIAVGKGLFGGLSAAVEKGLMRGIVKSIGTNKFGKLLVNAGRTGINFAESAVMAAISPATIQKALQNEAKIDQSTLQLTDTGWKITKIDTKGKGLAYWDAVKEQVPEYFTETGGVTQFAANIVKSSRFGKFVAGSTFGQLAKALDSTYTGKFLNQTAYNGVWQEWGEELENTFYQAVKAAHNAEDGKGMEAFKNTYGEFFSPETQVPMLLSFSLPAILGGTVGTAQAISINKKYDKAYDQIMNRFELLGYDKEEREDLLNTVLAKVYNADVVTNAGEGRALRDYPKAIREAAMEIIDGKYGKEPSQRAQDSYAMLLADLSEYIYADQNLSAIQTAHAKKQRQVQGLIREIEATEQQIQNNTHTDGMMYHVNLNGQAGYVVSGAMQLNTYDNAELPVAMNNDVVTVRMEDGSVKQVSANQLQLLEQPQSSDNIATIERRRLTAKMNNLDRFKVGDVIYLTKNGQPIDGNSSRVLNVTNEGVEVAITDPNGQPNTTVIPHEVAEDGLSTIADLLMQDEGKPYKVLINNDNTGDPIVLQEKQPGKWTDVSLAAQGKNITYTQEQVNEMIATGEFKVLAGDAFYKGDTLGEAVLPTTEESGSGNGVVSEETGEIEQPIGQPQAAAPVPSKYPTTQEGKLDWGQMDVPTATEAAIEKFGDKNTAKEYAELQIAQAKKAVAAANKKKATSTDADEFVAQKNAIKQEQQAAQAELSKWENILLGIANYKTAEEQAAAEQAAAQAAAVRAQRKQTIEGVGGTNMAERLAASPRIDGNAGSITAADGTKIPGHYVLVSANALTPSHNPNANFAPSEGYPTVDGQSINDRDYQADQEEQAKVQQVAQTYDGRAITNMPIVSDEGLVYSGNGRTMAGQLAAANGTDGAYKEALMENATQFGFTPEQVESVPNARVVFMTDERLPYNTSTLALFNQNEQQTQSNTASAAANVRKLTPEAVGHIIAAVQEFDTVDAFFGDSRAPFELVNRLIADGIISERDKAAFVDNGRLTNTGKDRLTALLFGTAFDEKTIRLLGDNAKVRNSVMRALPQILENKGLGDFSLFEHINNAIAAIYDMDTNKMSFFEFTRQIDIEGKTASDKYTAFELLLVDEMVNGGVQAFRDVLSGYNARAKESAGGQMDLFTGEVLTTEELTKQILQEYEQREANERGGAQPESAAAGTSESDGERRGQTIEGDNRGREQSDLAEIQPIGESDFGEVFDQFRGKPKEAIEFLKSRRSGEALGALYHSEIGEIDLVWGYAGTGKSDGFGLAKLLKFHPEVVDNLQEILNDMHIVSQNETRIQLESERYKAAVRLTWDGERKTWLLTAFEKNSSVSDKTTDTTETSEGKQDDTALLQNTANSADKGTKNVPNTQEKTQKSVEEQKNSSTITLTDGRVVTLSTITDKDFALLGDITPIQRSLIAVKANAVQNPDLKLKTAGYCNTTRRLLFNELPSEKKDLPTLRDIYFRTQQEYVNTPNKTQEYRFAADEVLKEIRRRLAYVDPENYPPKQGSANVSRLNDAELAVAEAETDTNPTEAQKKAENYKQGHVTLWGLPFTIENPKGSVRRGTDANGKQWEQVMNNTYGKIRRTEGVDGDHIDVFFGPNLQSDKVFVVDQLNVDTKEFDEHKVMLGFDSMEEAQAAYLSNYEQGWQGMGPVTETTMDEFKKWIESSHRKTKPFNEYKSVKQEGAASCVTTPVQKSVSSGKKASNKTEKTQGSVQNSAQLEQKNAESNKKTQNVGKNAQEAAMRIAKAEADMQEFARKLGAQGVHLISDKEQLPNEEGAAYRAIRNGANVMGWYNPKTNQVYIYLPNANNLQEVYKTLLHEFVAHKGLRDMLGKEKFDQLCHEVWDMMSEQDKLQYALYVKNNTAVGSKAMQELMDGMTEEEKAALLSDTKLQLAAADEYMAHFAETGVSEQDRSIWQRIVDAVRDLLRKAGINLRLTDADIARLLYESSRRLSSDMTMRERSLLIAKNNKVVENITTNAESMGFSTDTRFRITPEEDQAYLDAVNSGDMATAEQMLRDAAERAGYLPQADYQDAHGAPRASVEKEDFTNAEAMQEAADNGEDTNLWAVAQGISIQPDDYFSPQGPRWYGYSNQSGMESYAALSSAIRSINSQLNEYGEVKDMPIVKVYRTVPTDIVGEQLESEGQWVTPSLEYAIKHGENRFDGNYRIIDQEVPADQLWWDGMDAREWGFDDGTINVYQNTENNRKLFEVTYDDNGNVIPLSKRFDKSKEDTRFRIGTQVVPIGDNTLVGLHNLSATKLRKAIKQGGLANPSAAVIDIAKQDHEQYGEISLIMPSSLVDSATGQNAGTYTGDIWSPTYPYIERKMNSKGTDKYYETINKVFENAPVAIKNRIQVIFVDMLDNQGDPDNLAYWYMLEKGIAPTDVIINSGISDDIKQRFEPLRDKHFVGDMNAEERGLLLSLAAELEGKTTEDLLQEAQEAKARYEAVLENENASAFSKRIATEAIDEIDTYGVRFNLLSETMRKINEAIDKDGGVNVNASIGAAVNYVQENGLKDDFDSWLDNLDNRFGIEEVIFDGYNRNGDRKYIKHTLENVSRIMNQQPIQNASSHGGLSATRGQLVERMSTLAQIRANKHRLAVINEYEDEQWKAMQDEWFNKIINPLSNMQQIDSNHFINMDIAEQRLLEAIMKKDPIAHLNREYGYSIAKDSEFAKSLKDLMQRLKELPSKYFETKFKRPVYLNEFVSAVVPQNLSQDLKDVLANAGVELYEYDEAQDGSRREATLQATESDDVRFRIIGEKGATNLDRAEEATTRLDNLAVAREMESAEKDAKTIKMATGWERGADGKWRYEVGENYEFENPVTKEQQLEREHRKASSEYYSLLTRIPYRTPKYASDAEKQRIVEARKQLKILKRKLDKSAEAYYSYQGIKFGISLESLIGEDNALFNEYPQLRDVGVQFANMANGGRGSYSKYDSYGREYRRILINKLLFIDDMKSTLAHEIQHAIQDIEGFAQGGNPQIYAGYKAQYDQRIEHLEYLKGQYGYKEWFASLSPDNVLRIREQYKGDKYPMTSAFVAEGNLDEEQKKNLTDALAEEQKYEQLFYNAIGGVANARADYYDWYRSLAGETESRNVQSRLGMSAEERRATLLSETEDVAREDQVFIYNAIEDASNDVRFKIGYDPMKDKTLNRTAAREMADIKASAERNGTYLKAPNGADTNLTPRQWLQVRTRAFKEWFGDWELAASVIDIVKAEKEHGFATNKDAEKWGKENIAQIMDNNATGNKGVITISKNAIEKFLSGSAIKNKESRDAHLSVLKVLPNIIHNGIIVESHPDYKKGEDGVRRPENGIGSPFITMYRLYGAVDIDGEVYRVKVTLKLDTSNGNGVGAYSYETTKIELLAGQNEYAVTNSRNSNNSISGAKLLQNVESSKQKGKKLLDFSQIVDENGEPMPLKHRTFAEFTEFDKEKIGSSTDPGAFGTGFYFGKKDWILYGNKTMEVFIDMKNPLRLNYGNAYEIKSPFFKEDVTNQEAAKAMTEWAIAQGYDGVIWEDGLQSEFVAYEPNQIKSATDNVGTFDNSSDDIRFRISNENQRIFVSNAEKAVEGIRQEKATPQQWLAMLEKNGGIKAGEDKWLGLSEWLKGQDKKSITKQEILDFISENQIQIEEVEYGNDGNSIEETPAFKEFQQEYEQIFNDMYRGGGIDGWRRASEDAMEEMMSRHGGEDFGMAFYGEGNQLQVGDEYAALHFITINGSTPPINETRLDYTTEGLENKREIALTIPTIESWNEADEVHFGDAGGGRAVAWVRFGETIDEDGSKILLIDEIQSKRHQEGREKGYREESKEELLERRGEAGRKRVDMVRMFQQKNFTGDEVSDNEKWEAFVASPEYRKAIQDENNAEDKLKMAHRLIPSAPFDKNWHELAMKRMLRYAAENGYDYVAWTTGAQQAERYDIGAVVESINAGISVMGDRLTDINYRGSNAPTRISHTDDGSIISISGNNAEHFNNAKNISDIVGKELSVKILSQTERGSDKRVEYRGIDLSVGGEGMKGFYDRMLPSFVSKYTKKWGAKVQDINLPNLEESAQTMHAVNVTESMKEDVMEGQPMFRISSDKNDVQNVATDIWNKYQYDGELESMRDVAEYAEEYMPKNEQTQALFDAIDKWRDEAEEDRLYYGMRGDLEPFEDAIMDEVERLMNATTQSKMTESEQLTFDALQEVAADAGLDVTVGVSQEEALKAITQSDEDVEPSIRTKAAPKKTGIGYKVFYRGKDGKLYPPMVANPNGADTPIGVWLDADAAPVAGESKTGRQQVKAGGKGTQGGSGTLAFRPGWHLGEIPYALQFNRKDETGERTLFPKDFVWAEVEYAKDVDYQAQAESYGYTENGKYRHSYAGLPRVPENGSYRYRTNPNPLTDPWIITGAMKVNRVLTKEEVDEIVRKAGREPQPVELLVNPINGTILGYAQGNRIVLTREGMNPETMVHEYTHIWAKAMQRNNRAGWENIMEIFKQSPLWEYVKNDPNYKGRLTTDDAICSEVLARFSSRQGAERLDEVAREFIYEEQQKGGSLGAARVRQFINHARQAIKSFWKWVGKNLFGITKFDSQEDVADRVLYDLVYATDLEMLDAVDELIEFAWETPEQAAAMEEWSRNNPKPLLKDYANTQEWVNALHEHNAKKTAYAQRLKEERKKEFARMMLKKAIRNADSADPITEPQVEKPKRQKEETAYEYAMRLKAYTDSLAETEVSRWYQKVIKMFSRDWWIIRYVDRALPLRRFFEAAKESGAKITDESYAYDQVFLAKGRIQYAFEKFNRNEFANLTEAMRDIIDSKQLDSIELVWQNMDIHDTGYSKNGERVTPRELIGLYAQAKDCEEAEEKGLPDRGKDGFLKNIGISYQELIKLVEGNVDSLLLDNLWKATRACTQFALKYELDSRFISPEKYAENNREYYVPQRGWREQAESSLQFIYGSMSGKTQSPTSAFNAALVKARGRHSLADDPYNYIASITYSAIMQSENNKIGQSMLKFCLDNLEWGAKHKAFRMRRLVLMNDIDPETGKVRKDENGIPITIERYSEPSAEDKKHDEAIHNQIKNIKKSLGLHKKALAKELEVRGIETPYTKALQREIAKEETQIADLQDTLRIATNISNADILQRSSAEKLQHSIFVVEDGKRYEITFTDPNVANVFNRNNRVIIKRFLQELTENIGDAVMLRAQLKYERIKKAYDDGRISEDKLKKAEKAYKRTEKFAEKLGPLMSVLRNSTNLYAGALTQYNPVFAGSNVSRDFGFAKNHLRIAHPELVKDFRAAARDKELWRAVWLHAFNDKLKDKTFYTENEYGRLLEEYFESGAQTGYSYLPELREIKRDLNKALKKGKVSEALERTIDAFSLLTEYSENYTRFCAFVAARKNDWSATAAASLAKNLTTNFDKRGEVPLPMCYAFLRASVNALSTTWSIFRKAPKRFAYIALAHVAVGMINQLLNPNDPDDEIWASDYIRENNYVIWKFRIPVAHFFRAFHAIGVNMMMAMQGSKTIEKALYGARMAIYREVLPGPFNVTTMSEWSDENNEKEYKALNLIQGLAPSVISPITDVMINRNFMGSTINKEPYPGQENTKDIFLAKERTDEIYKRFTQEVYELAGGDMSIKNKMDDDWLADKFDWSASTVEHLKEGYALGVFEFVGSLLGILYNAVEGKEISTKDMPFVNKFYNTYSNETAYNQLYWSLYRQMDEYGKLVKEYKAARPEKYNKEIQSDSYRYYTYAKENKLLKEPKENPTLEDVKQLYELQKQWTKASK